MAKPKRNIRVPSILQICLPVEAYDAVEQIAAFEGSTTSQIGRRAVLAYLVQTGMMKPPQMKAPANQQHPAV